MHFARECENEGAEGGRSGRSVPPPIAEAALDALEQGLGLIYTANAIERFNTRLRKIIKTLKLSCHAHHDKIQVAMIATQLFAVRWCWPIAWRSRMDGRNARPGAQAVGGNRRVFTIGQSDGGMRRLRR